MIRPSNQILVIFGASGDLTEKKLMPSLYNLFQRKYLPEHFLIIGIGRTEYTDEKYHEKLMPTLVKETGSTKEALTQFLCIVHYIALDTSNAGDYIKLKQALIENGSKVQMPLNVIYYLATPPSLYATIAESLAVQELSGSDKSTGWKRLIVEKPFGYDLKSAKELNMKLQQCFPEENIYRIDHYLGKETVQNIMVTRFVNGFFEPVWNRNFVDRVEITAAESVGIEGRGGYYEGAGALRDMVQNHLMHLLSIVAMEPPTSSDSTSIRNEILKVFQCIKPCRQKYVDSTVVRGQYIESTIGDKRITGYRQEQGVSAESKTETYVALKTYIENWRWSGVPFYIRTGKMLPTRVTEVVIHFKPAPHKIFCTNNEIDKQINQLIIRIQPDEGLLLKFGMKVPGAGFMVQPVNMDFHYSDLTDSYIPSAYERLLLDCMNGDSTLYSRADSMEAAWDYLQPILDEWKSTPLIKMYGYPAGTWGPEAANALFDNPESTWRYPCKNLTNDGQYCEL